MLSARAGPQKTPPFLRGFRECLMSGDRAIVSERKEKPRHFWRGSELPEVWEEEPYEAPW
jgi:hypothetical protein